MIQHRRTTLLAILLIGTAPALAQSTVDDERTFWSGWPEVIESSTLGFERVVLGRFGDDEFRDAAVLRSLDGASSVGYLSNVHRFNHLHVFRDSARDIALLPSSASDGRDGLVVLTAAGIELYEVGASGVFELAAGLGTPEWQGARRLWCVQDAAGSSWVLGRDATGNKLLRASWDPATRSFTARPDFFVPAGLVHVEALNYDGPDKLSELELALWVDPWLYVTTWDGTPLIAVNSIPNPGDDPPPHGAVRGVTVSQGDDLSPDPMRRDLICLYGYWSAAQAFTVSSFNDVAMGWTVVAPSASNAGASRGVVSADWDGDGFEDLLLPHPSESRLTLLRRTSAAPDPFERSAGLGDRIELVVGPDLPTTGIDLVGPADLDGDGDVDLLALQAAGVGVQSVLSRSETLDTAPAGIWLDLATLVADPQIAPWSIAWEVQLPTGWRSFSPAATHVLLEGWFQPDHDLQVLPVRRIRELVPMPDPGDPVEWVLGVLQWDPAQLAAGKFVLQLHASLVEVQGEEITLRYPSRLQYFTPSAGAEDKLEARMNLENTGVEQIPNQGSGDGNISGNRGNPNPPSPPPSPNG